MTNENLVLDKVYNYKELCEAMGEEVAGKGKSRQLQQQRIKQYCEFDKPSGQKYQITKIYDKATTEYLKNKDNCSKYLANLILDALIYADRAGVEYSVLTRNEIYKDFWFCNDNYFELLETKRQRKDNPLLPYDSNYYLPEYNYPKKHQTRDISRWLSVSNTIFNQILDGAIRELRDYRFCEVHPTYRFYKEKVNVNNGEKYYISYDATEEELRQFLAIQRQVLKELGFNSMQTVYANPNNIDDFYNKVKQYLQKEMGYDAYARSYKFITMKDIGTQELFNRPQYNKLIIEKLKTSEQTKVIPEKLNEILIETAVKK